MNRMRARHVLTATAVVAFFLVATPIASAHAPPAVPAASSLRAASVHYTIPTGKEMSGYAYDPTTFDVYITNEGSDNVTVVSSTSHTHSSIAVGKSPYGIVYDPGDKELYVPNYNSSNVSVISASTNKVVANPSLGTGFKPILAVYDPASGDVLVLNSTSSLGIGVGWMLTNGTNAVKKITFATGTFASVAYNPKSKDLYLVNYIAGTLSIVSGTGTVTSLSIGGSPTYDFVDPANNDTYAWGPYATKSHDELRISVIAPNNTIAKTLLVSTLNTGYPMISTGGYDPATKDLYLLGANYTTNKSYALVISSSNAISKTITLGAIGYIYAFYDPANGDMYLASELKTIGVISGTTLKSPIKTSQSVPFLVYDPTLKDMVGAGYVNLKTVSVLNLVSSNGSLSTLKVGKGAIAPFYDPKDTYVYVANLGSDDLELVG